MTEKVQRHQRRRSRDLVIFCWNYLVIGISERMAPGKHAHNAYTRYRPNYVIGTCFPCPRGGCPERVFTVYTCIYTEHTAILSSRCNLSMAEKACVQRLQKEFRALCKVSSLSPLKLSYLYYTELQSGGPSRGFSWSCVTVIWYVSCRSQWPRWWRGLLLKTFWNGVSCSYASSAPYVCSF